MSPKLTTFTTKLLGFGNNTGIEVPPANIAELGSSKKPPIEVSVNGYTYKSTVAVMNGRYMISFAKAHREASGIQAGDQIKVVLVLDEGVREVVIPEQLRTSLQNENLLEAFNKLAYSSRKEAVRQVNDAKAEETRGRRIEKIVASLRIQPS